MKTAEYDFFLPKELIAFRPSARRDHSRLLVVHKNGSVEHRHFFDLPCFLNPGDMILLNNSKVFPARLCGKKPTGGRLEILLLDEEGPGIWNILSKERFTGTLQISEDFRCEISEGSRACFDDPSDLREKIWKYGAMPLPPYIRRKSDAMDRERYQTVYAEVEGSIAAPTAGLHFTEELFDALAAKSVLLRPLTLHVGVGTFRPVKAEAVEEHLMEKEFFEIPAGLPADIERVKQAGNRVFAVGTTATRAIEGYMSGRCDVLHFDGTIRGATDIFIREGYSARAVDCLITNFHLPRSTPLMLASAFSGREKLLEIYRSAVLMGYRFFSYGDAMLVL